MIVLRSSVLSGSQIMEESSHWARKIGAIFPTRNFLVQWRLIGSYFIFLLKQ